MSITISTKALVELLTDLLDTADSWRGIHLRTTRGHWGEDPDETTLLAGTSTTGAVMGHTWTVCTGDLQVSLWPAANCRILADALKKLAKGDKGHAVDIRIDGNTVIVVETATLFDHGAEFQFEVHDAKAFPMSRLRRIIDGDPLPTPRDGDGDERENTNRTTWNPASIEPLLKIANRRKEQLHLFRTHSNQIHRAQIGNQWVGAAAPSVAWDHDDPDKPNTDVYLDPSVPVDGAWLLRYGGGVFAGRESDEDTPTTTVTAIQPALGEEPPESEAE
ncbi:hypothetical protein [Rhodococcus sp. JVH1]|uniref:hypothetical protein n=1 Tax=Rhodococcus sp. JVH1 TaxID=745408 RepID=UPI00027207E7|nr:hypothetical protein [Rhodococcus sp. JVH1]EJJ01012.1 hypothetical protein JVH1_1638 [Rhodococcus sp. JVH1]